MAKREKPQQIADELRRLIIQGEVEDGALLGHEPELIERFGVSRPSLREALRILEAEGLITVVRGVQGGVVVHQPDHRPTARAAGMVLQARDVALADVFEARTILEPAAVRILAQSRGRKAAAKALRALIAEQEEVIDDPDAFGQANARFHEELVGLAGNQTLRMMVEMLNEVVARAVTAVSQTEETRLGGHPPAGRPLPGPAGLPHRGGRRRRGRGALAHAHDRRRPRHARPAGQDRGRPARRLRLSPSRTGL